MNVLLITSTPRGETSLSTRFARDLAEGLKARQPGISLAVRDLSTDPLPHISTDYIDGRFVPTEFRSVEQTKEVMRAEVLIAELNAADMVIIGSGMINFGLSTLLKAWFDHVIWPGVTVKYTEAGAQGLIIGKKVFLVAASGGVFSDGALAAFDFHVPYVRHLLSFIGLTDIEEVRIEGTAYGPDALERIINASSASIQAIVNRAA
jgi:FMN-dependent NADH-azoreductase